MFAYFGFNTKNNSGGILEWSPEGSLERLFEFFISFSNRDLLDSGQNKDGPSIISLSDADALSKDGGDRGDWVDRWDEGGVMHWEGILMMFRTV